MTQNDAEQFFEGLATLGLMFGEKLTPETEQAYWQALAHQCTITLWETACQKALLTWDTYCIPPVTVLLEYIDCALWAWIATTNGKD